ncbi:MAG: hypothetical protein Q9172_003311 [Xanthocarpia lactea]
MASHSLAIAKASLAAGLMRPDPSAASKTDIVEFHRLLDALLLQCSTTNVQLCKEWLLQNIAPSADKTKAVGKYLVALSASLSSTVGTNALGQAKQQKVPDWRRQLHILYLLHDLFHHTKFHGAPLADGTNVIRTLETYLTQLVIIAATYDQSNHRRHFGRLQDLIKIWDENEYLPSSVVAVLRNAVTNASIDGTSVARNTDPSEATIGTARNGIGESSKDAPYIMPASHGEASVPFYDLPAGNLMPCIVPNSLTPINPQMVKPLQFRAGPADENLTRAVKAFLQDVNVMYGSKMPEQAYDRADIDELGQPVAIDDTPDEFSASEGYYGWSKAFCEKMKVRSTGDRQTTSSPRQSMSQQLHKRRRRTSRHRDGRWEHNAIPALSQEQLFQAAPPPPAFLQQGILSPGQIPIPPPAPPNYTGPWFMIILYQIILTVVLLLAAASAPAAFAVRLLDPKAPADDTSTDISSDQLHIIPFAATR